MLCKKLYAYYLLLITYCVLSGCAQIVTPGGGNKDVLPPRIISYKPDSASTRFSSKNITITFNEFIQVADLKSQLTISPPMKIQPDIQVRGKSLIIKIIDTLQENRTYNFNFGNAIKDITEGNTYSNFQYIFSTGKGIDTLSLNGIVKNANNLKTQKDILVMLYPSAEDSIPIKKLPDYFARTKEDGTFQINNIRSEKYKVFALQETNANYLYDSPSESIAFSDTLINIRKKKNTLDLYLFKESPKKLKLIRSYARGYGSVFLNYTKSVDSISFIPMNRATQTETFITEFNSTRDTIQIWVPVFSKDSLYFQVTANGILHDTIKISTRSFDKNNSGREEAFKLTMNANIKTGGLLDLNKKIILNFNHPLIKEKFIEQKKKVLFKQDSLEFFPTINLVNNRTIVISQSKNIQTEFNRKQELITSEIPDTCLFKENSQINLFIPPGTFTDIFGLSNDTIKLDFKTQEEKFYGTLKMGIKMKDKPAYLLLLTNEKGELFNLTSSNKDTILYTYLPPGPYKLKIIYDTNKDGKWTTGNYFEKRNPEKIIYYPGAITIRSNWDLELEWKIE